MRHSNSIQNRRSIITTSWDDGHPFDIRLAELLAKYGLKGTFYVPQKYNGQSVLSGSQLVYLRQLGMEIGSHTVTHPILTKINSKEAFGELHDSKKMLEDTLGEGVTAFCYPGGKFNQVVRSQVIKAGYRLARTTVGFRPEINFDPFCMPVSMQFFPHKKLTHFRHATIEGNIAGLLNWIFRWRSENGIQSLAGHILDHVVRKGGIFHIWGHSWEIDSVSLWNEFEELLTYISNEIDALHLTNSQVLDFTHL